MNRKVQTLGEKIAETRKLLILYQSIVDTYPREKQDIAQERDHLDRRERLLDAAYRDAPGIIARQTSCLEELQRQQDQKADLGPPMSKSKAARLIEKRDRIMRKLRDAQKQLERSMLGAPE